MAENVKIGRGEAREALLKAALAVIRTKGFAATSVDDLCAAAGVTKGAFFHHFASKAALGVAAAEYWSSTTGMLFAGAGYHEGATARERVLGYIAFRRMLIAGAPEAFSCLAGTMVQEVFHSDPAIREACRAAIFDHAETLTADIAAALSESGRDHGFSALSLALHTQAVLQGGFILAKAAGDPAIAIEGVDHLARYVGWVLGREGEEG